MTKTVVLLTALVLLAGCAGPAPDPITITNGHGEMAGEVTANSVILQSRLTTLDGLVDGDVAGASGTARFELALADDFTDPTTTAWLDAVPEGDYIVKTAVDGLSAGTRYFYRLEYGPTPENTRLGPTRSFRTLPGADAAEEVSFVVVTGMNYALFHGNGPRAGSPEDRPLGYPGLAAILAGEPAFFVGTGDNVYYDAPFSEFERTQSFLRKKWHQQFVQPRFIDLFASVPTYWEKDDHDYRFNDCDNTVDLEPDPSPELGKATFLEQVPVVDPNDPEPRTYRTHRVSRDLQIWLTEGRDYRSPNMAEPGPDKTLWGAEQLAWLKETLLASDATFKILISPTPMIGPDDADQAGRQAEGHDPFKRDNQSNPMGFQYERDRFFDWLEENRLPRQPLLHRQRRPALAVPLDPSAGIRGVLDRRPRRRQRASRPGAVRPRVQRSRRPDRAAVLVARAHRRLSGNHGHPGRDAGRRVPLVRRARRPHLRDRSHVR